MTKRNGRKTCIILLLVFCIIIEMIPVQGYAAENMADEKMYFYGGNITAAPGETVEFPVYVENNHGMSSTKIYLNSSSPRNVSAVQKSDGKSLIVYPGSVFSSGSILTNTVEEGWLVLWYSAGNVIKNGELFTMKFKVADDAKSGTYSISLAYSKNDTANVNGENLDVTMKAGTITIKKPSSPGNDTVGNGNYGDGSTSDGSSSETVVPPENNEKEEETIKAFISDVKKTTIKLSSRRTTLSGKRAIKLTWKLTGDYGIVKEDLDGFMVHRSTKKSRGYGVKPYKITEKQSYTNSKELKKGKTYYFKVRGYVEIDGKTYYTQWSNKAWRTIK